MSVLVLLLIIALLLFATWALYKLASVVQGDQRTQVDRQMARLPNFSPTLRFDDPSGTGGIRLDPAIRKFAVATAGAPARLFAFEQLVAVEVERNGSSLQKTNRGSQVAGAAVGAAFLGSVGLLLGGLTGTKRNEELVKRLALKIFTNDLHTPFHEIIFFYDAKGQAPNSSSVVTAARQLDEWHGRFQTILKMQ